MTLDFCAPFPKCWDYRLPSHPASLIPFIRSLTWLLCLRSSVFYITQRNETNMLALVIYGIKDECSLPIIKEVNNYKVWEGNNVSLWENTDRAWCTHLWPQLLGRLRRADYLSPGILGCSALYQLGVHPCSDFSPRRKAVEELISEMINLVLGC